jgi:regulator of protease activity HflC (stomatin/prohibitin superfamily)
MWKLVLAGVVLIAGLYFLAKGGPRTIRGEQTPSSRPLGVGLLLVAVALLGWSALYRLDTGEGAVIKSITGQVTDTEAASGAHSKKPWESVVKFNLRNQIINFVGTEPPETVYDDDNGTINDTRITGQTSDNADAFNDMTVTYSIDPGKLTTVYNDYKTPERLALQKILPGARGAAQLAPTRFPAATYRQSRAEVKAQMTRDINSALSSAGVNVTNIDLRSISFTKEVTDTFNGVQVAKGKSNSAREDLNTALINAEKKRVDAQADSDADQIARCGATSTVATRKINGQDVQETKVTPIPADKCQNRLNEQVLMSKWIDMLDHRQGDTLFVVPQGGNNLLQLPAPK